MIILSNEEPLLEFQVHPSLGSNSVEALLRNTIGRCRLNENALEVQKNFLKTLHKESMEPVELERLENYTDALESLVEKFPLTPEFQHLKYSGGCYDVIGNYMPASYEAPSGGTLSTAQLFDIEKDRSILWQCRENCVVHISLGRLQDWLAFDISHSTFDPDLYSNDKVAKYLGKAGIYLTAESTELDNMIPKDYSWLVEQYSLLVDYDDVNCTSAGVHHVAYNYFRQEIKKDRVRFSDLIYFQNIHLLICYFNYICYIATKLNTAVKLIGLGDNNLDIYTRGIQETESLILALQEGIKVRLFDEYSFRFQPTIKAFKMND